MVLGSKQVEDATENWSGTTSENDTTARRQNRNERKSIFSSRRMNWQLLPAASSLSGTQIWTIEPGCIVTVTLCTKSTPQQDWNLLVQMSDVTQQRCPSVPLQSPLIQYIHTGHIIQYIHTSHIIQYIPTYHIIQYVRTSQIICVHIQVARSCPGRSLWPAVVLPCGLGGSRVWWSDLTLTTPSPVLTGPSTLDGLFVGSAASLT